MRVIEEYDYITLSINTLKAKTKRIIIKLGWQMPPTFGADPWIGN